MSIIDRIICLVKENKLSGTQFGAILNLKKSPLTDWKNNKSKPTLDQIISICEYFAVSADYLLGCIDQHTHPGSDSITKSIQELPESERQMIEKFILSLKN
ncbi:MAG: helix-turn-helix transcriptional regulator [Vagococcus sp.]